MKNFTATFSAQNGFSHSVSIQAKTKKDANNFAQSYKRQNGYLGKTTICEEKNNNILKNAIVDSLKTCGVSDEYIKNHFIFGQL